MIGFALSLMIQAMVIAFQLTLWLIRIMVAATIAIVALVAEALETRRR